MKRFAIILVLLVFVAVCQAIEVKADDHDNAILAEVLQRKYEDGGFTVVAPITHIAHLSGKESDMEQMKKYVKDNLKIQGYDVGPLLDALIEKNRMSIRLSLESRPDKGYLIDYDGKFEKYFETDGGGWDKWYKENPIAHGRTSVSLPVVDEKAGIVLVYMGTQSNWLSGAGYIIAYRNENGKLKELGGVMLWIS